MATIFSHSAVSITSQLFLGKNKIPSKLMILGAAFSMLPDLDIVSFYFGIEYANPLGHRGFSHSILFAFLLSVIASILVAKYWNIKKSLVFSFLFLCTISHGVLDAMTSGGLGVGFFIPLDNTRYFFPYRPIRVSPIGIKNFLTHRGVIVLQSEIVFVWFPLLVIGSIGYWIRKFYHQEKGNDI